MALLCNTGTLAPPALRRHRYPIHGYLEPDGTARQALDADGDHDLANGLGHHYHGIGTSNNTNGVATLDTSFTNDPPTLADMELMRAKVNELVLAPRR